MLEFNLHLLGRRLAALASALGRLLGRLLGRSLAALASALGRGLAGRLAHASKLGHVSLGGLRTLDHVGGLGLATPLLLGRSLTGGALRRRFLGSGATATAGRGEGSRRK